MGHQHRIEIEGIIGHRAVPSRLLLFTMIAPPLDQKCHKLRVWHVFQRFGGRFRDEKEVDCPSCCQCADRRWVKGDSVEAFIGCRGR